MQPRAAPRTPRSRRLRATLCLPLRRTRAPARRAGPVHRRQSRPPDQQGVICAKGSAGIMKQVSPARLTQPLLRRPGSERGEGEFEPISWERATSAHRAPGPYPRHRSEEVRPVHRARPDAGPHRPVRAPVRHTELCGARRLLFGEHGCRHDLFGRRQLLGVRRPGPGSRQAVRDDRHRGRPPQQPDEDRLWRLRAQGQPLHLDQPRAHRLFGDRRRVGFRSAPAPTAHCSWRCCTNCSRKAWSTGPSCSGSPMRRNWWCWTRASAKACSPSIPPPARPATAATRTTSWHGTWPAAGWQAYPEGVEEGRQLALEGHLQAGGRDACGASLPAVAETALPTPRPRWAEDITGIPSERIRQLAREVGRRRCTRPSNFPFPGPMRGEAAPHHPAGGRWPSTPCAGWRRIPTVSRRCARWRCS